MLFGIFIYDGVEPIDLATFGVLSMARRIAPHIGICTVAPKAGIVRLSNGLDVVAQFGIDDAPICDMVIVTGGSGWEDQSRSTATLEYIRRVHASAKVASVCTGAMILAASGILDDAAATTKRAVVAPEVSPLARMRQTYSRIDVREAPIVNGAPLSPEEASRSASIPPSISWKRCLRTGRQRKCAHSGISAHAESKHECRVFPRRIAFHPEPIEDFMNTKLSSAPTRRHRPQVRLPRRRAPNRSCCVRAIADRSGHREHSRWYRATDPAIAGKSVGGPGSRRCIFRQRFEDDRVSEEHERFRRDERNLRGLLQRCAAGALDDRGCTLAEGCARGNRGDRTAHERIIQ